MPDMADRSTNDTMKADENPNDEVAAANTGSADIVHYDLGSIEPANTGEGSQSDVTKVDHKPDERIANNGSTDGLDSVVASNEPAEENNAEPLVNGEDAIKVDDNSDDQIASNGSTDGLGPVVAFSEVVQGMHAELVTNEDDVESQEEDDPWRLKENGMDLETYAHGQSSSIGDQQGHADDCSTQDGHDRSLRAKFRRKTFNGAGWNDKDETGNYDPDSEIEKSASREKRRKLVDGRPQNLQTVKAPTYEQGRRMGRQLIVKIDISTHESVRKFIAELEIDSAAQQEELNEYHAGDELSDDQYDSGYGRSLPINIRATREGSMSPEHNFARCSETDPGMTLGHPSARSCHACYELGLDCSLIDDGLKYPCQNCRDDDNDCELILQPEHKSACEDCKRKQLVCSFCDDGGIGEDACQACQEDNTRCIAGPAISRRIDDVLANGGPNSGFVATEQRPFLSCSMCRRNRVRCSLKTESQPIPCSRCHENDERCTFGALPKPKRLKKQFKKDPTAAVREKEPKIRNTYKKFSSTNGAGKGRELSPLRQRNKSRTKFLRKSKAKRRKKAKRPQSSKPKMQIEGGTVRTIATNFCHPISFNYKPPPPSPTVQLACHFCAAKSVPGRSNGTQDGMSGRFYSIFGLGLKISQVIEWKIGVGNEELERGWSAEGKESTRMCEVCTTKRLLIINCELHKFEQIPNIDQRTFDEFGAYDILLKENKVFMDRRRNNGRQSPTASLAEFTAMRDALWCSICFSPAYFRCCTPQPYTLNGSTDAHGCGLVLCDVCTHHLIGFPFPLPPLDSPPPSPSHSSPPPPATQTFRAKTDLDSLIRSARRDKADFPDGVRADAEFLMRDGELYRRMQAGFGELVVVDHSPDADAEIEDRRRARGYEPGDEMEWNEVNSDENVIDLCDDDDQEHGSGGGGARRENAQNVFIDLT